VQRIRRAWPTVAAPGVTGLIIGARGADELRLVADLAGTRDAAQEEDVAAAEHLA
jgi:hypothetical protein